MCILLSGPQTAADPSYPSEPFSGLQWRKGSQGQLHMMGHSRSFSLYFLKVLTVNTKKNTAILNSIFGKGQQRRTHQKTLDLLVYQGNKYSFRHQVYSLLISTMSKYLPGKSRGLVWYFLQAKVRVTEEKGRVVAQPTGSFNKVEGSRAEYLFFHPSIPEHVATSHTL